jgi:hypothetical protein
MPLGSQTRGGDEAHGQALLGSPADKPPTTPYAPPADHYHYHYQTRGHIIYKLLQNEMRT